MERILWLYCVRFVLALGALADLRIVQANMLADKEDKLPEEELIGQMK